MKPKIMLAAALLAILLSGVLIGAQLIRGGPKYPEIRITPAARVIESWSTVLSDHSVVRAMQGVEIVGADSGTEVVIKGQATSAAAISKLREVLVSNDPAVAVRFEVAAP